METKLPKFLSVNGNECKIIELLGKGKGGYSYLVADNCSKNYVLKQIHHEPCEYYSFGDKIQSELNDYKRLKAVGIRMPELIDADIISERLLKEYIEGETVFDLVKSNRVKPEHFRQVREMCAKLYAAGLNIDYFPTNFIDKNGELFYIDYECNNYSDEWNFENWGIKYWALTPEFLGYINNPKQ